MCQEFNNEILDLVKQKGFYPYEYMCDFENINETLTSKNKFYILLSGKGISDKEYQHVPILWNKIEIKAIRDYHKLYLKCDVLLLTKVLEKIKNRWLELFEQTSFKLRCNT